MVCLVSVETAVGLYDPTLVWCYLTLHGAQIDPLPAPFATMASMSLPAELWLILSLAEFFALVLRLLWQCRGIAQQLGGCSSLIVPVSVATGVVLCDDREQQQQCTWVYPPLHSHFHPPHSLFKFINELIHY